MSRRVRRNGSLAAATQLALIMAAPRLVKALPPGVRAGGALMVAVFGPVLVAKIANRIRA